jgi:hypothetical protein
MVQMDGSDHDWFEGRGGRGKKCTLMVMVDDATGKKMGRFYAEETLEAALSMMTLWCKSHGVPESLYVDRAGIYRCDRDQTLEEVRTGKQPTTQFGRAMKELGVRLIQARSPQAKGRVERANGTLQDRLTKELRLAKIGSIESANAFLERSGFFEDLNERQAVAPVDDTDAHRPLVIELKDVLCIKDKRSVGHDGCVQWCGKILQLAAINGKSWPRAVEVSSSATGVLESIRSGAINWQWQELEKLPAKPAKKKIQSERGVARKPTALMRRQHNSLFNRPEPWPSERLRKAS